MSYHLQVMSPTRADVGKSISKSKRGNSIVDLTQKDDNMDGTNIGRSSLGSGGNPAPRKISKNQKDTASSSVVQSQSPILAFGALTSPKPAEKERSKNRSPRRPAPRRLELPSPGKPGSANASEAEIRSLYENEAKEAAYQVLRRQQLDFKLAAANFETAANDKHQLIEAEMQNQYQSRMNRAEIGRAHV